MVGKTMVYVLFDTRVSYKLVITVSPVMFFMFCNRVLVPFLTLHNIQKIAAGVLCLNKANLSQTAFSDSISTKFGLNERQVKFLFCPSKRICFEI